MTKLVGPDSDDAGLLAGFASYLRQKGEGFFRAGVPITVARGPARIDLMGGIADYSGSVVFEGTLGRAAVVGFQPRPDDILRVRSVLLEQQGRPCEVKVRAEELRALSYDDARALLTGDDDEAWAAYVLGAPLVLESEGVARLEGGGGFLLWSDVPVGEGVASSAAVEVAAMFALTNSLGLRLPAECLSALAQLVENRVVGAPCGIMDQVTSALGETGRLLALLCRPCRVLGLHELPEQARVFGVSSRVRHSVGGDAYTTARVSAFMGLKIILAEMERRGTPVAEEDRYLCNVTPDTYREEFRAALPETISGSDFLRTYGETTDAVTRVNPDRTYSVRLGAEHPIFENERVQRFIECMERARGEDRAALVEAGELMYASHDSYGRNCGLGCEETDLLVDFVRRRGPAQGLYGAKITGGGSGGTVAILADKDAEATVRQIAADYEGRTGLTPDIFDRSAMSLNKSTMFLRSCVVDLPVSPNTSSSVRARLSNTPRKSLKIGRISVPISMARFWKLF